MKTEKWIAQEICSAKHLGTLETESGESFEVVATATQLVFGGVCNVGFLQSGYMTFEEGETIDAALAELQEELNVYYRDGAQYVSRIVHNKRM